MAKTDWKLDDVVRPEDMNQIGAEINQLREDLDGIEIPLASTSQAGIVKLSNAVNSESETMAATPKAVKQAYDRADQAFQLGNERKAELVDALIAIGISASPGESWDSLIGKVASVIRATGNAVPGEVLAGRTFSNATANGLSGTMPNRGNVSVTLTQQGQEYTVPAGYHAGAGKVKAQFPNLTPENVRHAVNIGGVIGTFMGGVYAEGNLMSPASGPITISGLAFKPQIVCLYASSGPLQYQLRHIEIPGISFPPTMNNLYFALQANTGTFSSFNITVTLNNDGFSISDWAKSVNTYWLAIGGVE